MKVAFQATPMDVRGMLGKVWGSLIVCIPSNGVVLLRPVFRHGLMGAEEGESERMMLWLKKNTFKRDGGRGPKNKVKGVLIPL
jgi:hypothetical protein